MNKILAFVSFLTIGTFSYAQANFAPEEIRIGALKHDVKSGLKHAYEKGYDVNAELLWATPKNQFFQFIFSPRPHVGISLNTKKGTHQLYFGVTWRYDFLRHLFAELIIGGGFNTGNLHKRTKHKKALGSHIMFHEGVSLGVQFAPKHSLSLFFDHTSNASLARINTGLTGFGLRYGYQF
jgi:lipid A 3-O-deacylase